VFSVTMARTCASVIDGVATVDRRQSQCVIIVNWVVLSDTVITEETNSWKYLTCLSPIFDQSSIYCGEQMKNECG